MSILPAGDLWGKTTAEVEEALHGAHTARKRKILQIGPAGENLVRYANITADLRNFHGRGGLGAVMGSKNLRAIVVRGTHRKLQDRRLRRVEQDRHLVRPQHQGQPGNHPAPRAGHRPRVSCRSAFRASCRLTISRTARSTAPKASAARR